MTRTGINSQLRTAGRRRRVSAAPRSGRTARAGSSDDLKVKAGMSGVLQCVCSARPSQVERGAQVGPGTNLARVAKSPLP